MYNSINFLPPYLQKQPILQDLCFFIDYLEIDIDTVYNDLRYRYIDWSKVSEEGSIQTLKGLGMDYIVDLINVITPSNSTQLLGLASLIWLLKGQLLGVDIIASICGFNYTYTVWHEEVPLGVPNTATLNIEFVKYRALSEDFQYNFVEFLRKYLYPIVSVVVDSPVAKGEIYSFGYSLGAEKNNYEEVLLKNINLLSDMQGTFENCYGFENKIFLDTNILWHEDNDFWNPNGYYSTNGIWQPPVVDTASYTSQVYEAPSLALWTVSQINRFQDFGNSQSLELQWKYSLDNATWSDWEVLQTSIQKEFQFCRFKVNFNATESKQMILYLCEIILR